MSKVYEAYLEEERIHRFPERLPSQPDDNHPAVELPPIEAYAEPMALTPEPPQPMPPPLRLLDEVLAEVVADAAKSFRYQMALLNMAGAIAGSIRHTTGALKEIQAGDLRPPHYNGLVMLRASTVELLAQLDKLGVPA